MWNEEEEEEEEGEEEEEDNFTNPIHPVFGIPIKFVKNVMIILN